MKLFIILSLLWIVAVLCYWITRPNPDLDRLRARWLAIEAEMAAHGPYVIEGGQFMGGYDNIVNSTGTDAIIVGGTNNVIPAR